MKITIETKQKIVLISLCLSTFSSIALNAQTHPYKKSFMLLARSDSAYNPATGFVVQGTKGYYLVTNLHVFQRSADQLYFPVPRAENSKLYVRVRNRDNQEVGRFLLLEPLTKEMYYHWYPEKFMGGILGIAVLPLGNDLNSDFIENAFRLSQLETERKSEPGETVVTIGYPQDKFTWGQNFVLGNVDTMKLTLLGDYDNGGGSIFTFAFPRSGEGLSGAPILDTAKGSLRIVGVVRGEGTAVYSYYVKAIIEGLERPGVRLRYPPNAYNNKGPR
jgi:hypothetical protein